MPSTYQLISSNILSTSAASVTFSSIPSTYTDLVVRMSVRSTRAANSNQMEFTLNGDSNTVYSITYMDGIGSSVTSSRISNGVNIYAGSLAAQNVTANTFNNTQIYIPSYTASQNKPMSVFNAYENNSTSTNQVAAIAGLYRSTTAISSITFTSGSGSFSYEAGSSFRLYGIKNS